MGKIASAIATMAISACIWSSAQAAELLDVKPVVSGSAVSIEITADIPMTYTYYKVPGQARAVIDIADADPEKIEPLIVINKGMVSSISVDKAQIAGMVVSRVIFNLVSAADIAVTATPDRKTLTATFGGAEVAKQMVSQPDEKPVQEAKTTVPAAPAAQSEQASPKIEAVPAEQATATSTGAKEEDPLELNEPAAAPSPAAQTAAEPSPAVAEIPAQAAPVSSKKLEPVVPTSATPATLSIRNIETGDGFIDIQATGSVTGYKIITLTKPGRIAIDIPGAKSLLKARSVLINKFGVTKARIGINPGYIRVVFDSDKAIFPKHTVTNNHDSLRINFN
ncbi:MAG: AMIN domain-containing protein [Geobacter sp.]|nr:AMIN domain-containing protein [Geobacter sp.]